MNGCVAVMVALAALWPGKVTANALRSPAAKPGFTMRLETARREPETLALPAVLVRVTNSGDQTLVLAANSTEEFTREFGFVVRRKGKPVPYSAYGRMVYHQPGAHGDGVYHSVRVPPHSSIAIEFSLARLFDVSQESVYTVTCVFRGRADDKNVVRNMAPVKYNMCSWEYQSL